MRKIFAFLMILGFASSSCEPDDICDPATSTTPRMLIQFFDIKDPSTAKNVSNLKVIGVVDGKDKEGVILTPSVSGDGKYVTSGNSILLPLNTERDVVKYRLISNYDNENPLLTNEDILEFKYTRQSSYVSRACGFKTIFELDDANPFILTDKTPADSMWIRYVRVEQNNITSENETIIKIFI